MTYGTNRTHLLIQHVAAARAALPAGFAALERDGGPGQQCKDDGLHDPPGRYVRFNALSLQERWRNGVQAGAGSGNVSTNLGQEPGSQAGGG